MVQKTFTITNKMGLHMRPANTFVTEMSKFSSDVDIVFGGKRINGKSIMNIMAYLTTKLTIFIRSFFQRK